MRTAAGRSAASRLGATKTKDPVQADRFQLKNDPGLKSPPFLTRVSGAIAGAIGTALKALGSPQLPFAKLIDARSRFALLYRDAQRGKGDPALVHEVKAGNISFDDFVTAGAKSFQSKLEQQKADVDIARALLERNPSRTPEQAAADARSYNALFFDIKGSQTAFQEKIDFFNKKMPSYYRGLSRFQIGYDDIYAQKGKIGDEYNAINAKFREYEALVVAGKASTPQARQIATEVRGMLAKADALSHRSIDASLGRAASVGPVIDMATDLMVNAASTVLPGGVVVAGAFSAGKAALRGEITDVGSGAVAFAKGAAFSKLGALGRAGTFSRLGSAAVSRLGLQGSKWLPGLTGAALESGAMGLTSASLTAADLARQGKFDAGVVARSGLEGVGFGLANAGLTRASASLAQRVLGTRVGAPRHVAADVLSGGLSEAAGDALTQLAVDGRIDLNRVALSGLAGAGGTVALGPLSYRQMKGKMPDPASPAATPVDPGDAGLPQRDAWVADVALRNRALTVGHAEMGDIQRLAARIVRDEHQRARTSSRDAIEAIYKDKDLAARAVNGQYEKYGMPMMLVRVGEGDYVKLAGRELVDAVRAGDARRVAKSLRPRKPAAATLHDSDLLLQAAVAKGNVVRVIDHLRGDPAPYIDLSSVTGRASLSGPPPGHSGPSDPTGSPTQPPNRLITLDQDLIQLRALGAHGGPQRRTPLKPHEIDLAIEQINRNYADSGVPAAVVRVGDDVVKLQGSDLLAAFRAGDAEGAARLVRAAPGAEHPAHPELAAAVVRGDSGKLWEHLWGPLAMPAGPKPSLDLERAPYTPTARELLELRSQLAPELERLPLRAMGYTGRAVDDLVEAIASTKDYPLRLKPTGDKSTDQWVKTNIDGLVSPSGATAKLTVVWHRDPGSGEVRPHRVWMDGPGASRLELAALRDRLVRELQLDPQTEPEENNWHFRALGFTGEAAGKLMERIGLSKDAALRLPPSQATPLGDFWRVTEKVTGPSGASATLHVVWHRAPGSTEIVLRGVSTEGLTPPPAVNPSAVTRSVDYDRFRALFGKRPSGQAVDTRQVFESAEWGELVLPGQKAVLAKLSAAPEVESGLTPSMRQAIALGMDRFTKATGIRVAAAGFREVTFGSGFWHKDTGGLQYPSKPSGTEKLDSVAAHALGLGGHRLPDGRIATQLEFGAPKWVSLGSLQASGLGRLPAPADAVDTRLSLTRVARPDGQTKYFLPGQKVVAPAGSTVTERVPVDVVRMNWEDGRVGFKAPDGTTHVFRRVISDIDPVYVVDSNGTPLSNSQTVLLGHYINQEYQEHDGAVVNLIGHGPDVVGVNIPSVERKYNLREGYADEPVLNFGPDGSYLGETRWADTIEALPEPRDLGEAFEMIEMVDRMRADGYGTREIWQRLVDTFALRHELPES